MWQLSLTVQFLNLAKKPLWCVFLVFKTTLRPCVSFEKYFSLWSLFENSGQNNLYNPPGNVNLNCKIFSKDLLAILLLLIFIIKPIKQAKHLKPNCLFFKIWERKYLKIFKGVKSIMEHPLFLQMSICSKYWRSSWIWYDFVHGCFKQFGSSF